MKNLTAEAALKMFDSWKSLEAFISKRAAECSLADPEVRKATNDLTRIRVNCKHEVIVHTETEYIDTGFGDPEFESCYVCYLCGSTSAFVPANLKNPGNYCFNAAGIGGPFGFSNEARFAITNYRVRQIIRNHPDFTLKQVEELANSTVKEDCK